MWTPGPRNCVHGGSSRVRLWLEPAPDSTGPSFSDTVRCGSARQGLRHGLLAYGVQRPPDPTDLSYS